MTGDLTDINNYRAITLSNAVTKILECILLAYVKDKCAVVDSQFGFKSGHSASLCTHSFYRAMHFSANARSWDRMSSVCLSVCLSVCNVGDL